MRILTGQPSPITEKLEKGRVDIRNLKIQFPSENQSLTVLDNINLTLDPGEFVCLLGPSGCGKSTVLNVVAGFIQPTSGSVSIHGVPIESPGPDRGVVFQQYSLFPWKTVLENVEFGLKVKGMKPRERRELACEYLNEVGLGHALSRYPHQLSGGMQQRVSIARALVNHPEVLLLDEPFAALDAQTRSMMQELLLSIWERMRTTVLFITHDVDEAIYLGDWICVMTSCPGSIKSRLHIDLPRPRSADIVISEDYFHIKQKVHTLIREESLKALRLSEIETNSL